MTFGLERIMGSRRESYNRLTQNISAASEKYRFPAFLQLIFNLVNMFIYF